MQVAKWERTHRGFIEDDLLAAQQLAWVENAVRTGQRAMGALQSALDRVQIEVSDLERKISACAMQRDAVQGTIDSIMCVFAPVTQCWVLGLVVGDVAATRLCPLAS